MNRFRLSHYLRTSLWLVPVVCTIGGVLLSFITIAVDRNGKLIPQSLTGGPDAALMILGTVAASMVTLTGLVLTIVLVVVQLAMGQFSPRIVRAILRDRPSQLAIGVFVATFAHAMLAMREVRSTEPGSPVPGLAIVVAFVLVVVSIVVLILYVHHIGQSLRVAALIEVVGRETRSLVDRIYPDAGTPSDDPADVIPAPYSGVLFRVDHEALVRIAADSRCTFELQASVGEFVPAGAPLFRIFGDTGSPDRDRALAAVALGPERTMNQDVAYGFRMLVDIAQRSLSDSNDDPTTAVQAVDRLHDCLRQLARRQFPSGRYHDEEGELRLVAPTLDWEGYVRLAFDEIRQAGASSPQVLRRLRAAVEDLLTVVPPERRAALEQQQALLEQTADRSADDDRGRHVMLVADPVGIGSGEDLLVDLSDRVSRRSEPQSDGG